ncbi:MAG: hypothetical protein LUG87_02060, partial [Oscillospiraceae bacterium]|nr:hypothetical protein [Oscillospiraceae bacterium]
GCDSFRIFEHFCVRENGKGSSDFGSVIPDRDFPIQQRLDALVLPVGTHSRCKQAHAGQYTKMEYFFFMIF